MKLSQDVLVKSYIYLCTLCYFSLKLIINLMMLIFYTRTNCLMTLNRTSTPKILEVGRGGSVNSASRLLGLKPRVNSHSAFYTSSPGESSHNPHPCFSLPPHPRPRLAREHLDPPLFADLESSTLPFSDFYSPLPQSSCHVASSPAAQP